MKRFDEGHLHPLPKHHETNMSHPGIEPGPPASQASTPQNAIRTVYAVAIRNLYRTLIKKGYGTLRSDCTFLTFTVALCCLKFSQIR
jgi:hypothetical protein